MKKIYISSERFVLIFLLSFLDYLDVYAQNSSSEFNSLSYVSEEFSFSDMTEKLNLRGTLILPQKMNSFTKIVILVAPPFPIYRDYYGLFSTLADVLGRNGIATLRFDNRAYSDNTLLPRQETVTMYHQANDVHNAILKLRKDKRFNHNPIGLLGHSEGGCSVAIEASKNKTINFAIFLSTCGIKGVEFAYNQTAMPLMFNERIDNTVKENMLLSMSKYLDIVNRYNSLDSMKICLSKAVEAYYNSVQNKKEVFDRSTLQEISETISWTYTRPRFVAFVKYDPKKYFSDLSCPVLVMCGKMDGVQDCEKNLDGIVQIFRENGKKEYEILAIDSVNHGYRKVKALVPMFIEQISSHNPRIAKSKFAIDVFQRIADWIDEH